MNNRFYLAIIVSIATAHNFIHSAQQVHTQDQARKEAMEAILRNQASTGTLTRATLQFCLAAKANIDAQDERGETALMRAIQHEHLSIVKLLLDAHANVTIQNKKNKTALYLAASTNNIAILQLLLNADDINAKHNESNCWLMSAVISERKEVLALLLKHYDRVDEQNWEGKTALTYILFEKFDIKNNNVMQNIIQLLIAKGANPHVRTRNKNAVVRHYRGLNYTENDIQYLLREYPIANNETAFEYKPELLTIPFIQQVLVEYERLQQKREAKTAATTVEMSPHEITSMDVGSVIGRSGDIEMKSMRGGKTAYRCDSADYDIHDDYAAFENQTSHQATRAKSWYQTFTDAFII